MSIYITGLTGLLSLYLLWCVYIVVVKRDQGFRPGKIADLFIDGILITGHHLLSMGILIIGILIFGLIKAIQYLGVGCLKCVIWLKQNIIL